MSASLAATAEQVEAAWHDTKLIQVLYHDWEAQTYDEKWSISFDQRCIDYARDRFVAVAGAQGRPYGDALEVGCGTGFFSLNLCLAGLIDRVHVTDISPGMVEAARRNGDRLGIPVEGRVADAERLPYPDDTFDLVIGHAVVHHVPDVWWAFAEMLRVLRPGGRLVTCGEPTRWGDYVARRLSRATWWAATRITRLPRLRDTWARPQEELDESSRALRAPRRRQPAAGPGRHHAARRQGGARQRRHADLLPRHRGRRRHAGRRRRVRHRLRPPHEALDVPIKDQGLVKAPVRIGPDFWIGTKATVLRGTHVGHGSVLAAHAVVRGTVPAWSVVAGVPARVVRDRRDSS